MLNRRRRSRPLLPLVVVGSVVAAVVTMVAPAAQAATTTTTGTITSASPTSVRQSTDCTPGTTSAPSHYVAIPFTTTGTSATTISATVTPNGFRGSIEIVEGGFVPGNPLVNCYVVADGTASGAPITVSTEYGGLPAPFTDHGWTLIVFGYGRNDVGSFSATLGSTNTGISVDGAGPVQPPADTTPPVITVPATITTEADSSTGRVVNYTASANDAADGNRPVSCSPASGSRFPLGTTTVTCAASDTKGNNATKTFDVVVRDTTGPVLTLPSTTTREATSGAGAVVTYTASATDLVDGNRPVTCAPASGSTFALGTTSVSCSATDSRSNTTTANFQVVVRDTTGPIISIPTQITREGDTAGGAAVTYSASANDLVDGNRPVSCAPASGSLFAVGTTTVTCTSQDTRSNSSTKVFAVQVQDTGAPVLTLPTSLTVTGTARGTVVTYAATASDVVEGPRPVTCTPASGSTFAPGVTTVSCSTEDSRGNSATGSFPVTVNVAPTITSASGATFTVGTDGTFTATTAAGYPVATTLAYTGGLPPGVTFIDNGDGTATLRGTPAAGSAGSYPVTIIASNGAGSTTQTLTLTVERATQLVTVTTPAPNPATVLGTYTPSASAASGLTVTVTVDPATTGSSCSISGGIVTFAHAGSCVLAFDQAGDGTYRPAPRVLQTITVVQVATSLALTTEPTVYGQPARATATVTPAAGTAAGTVQFSVDGNPVGAPVALALGQAISPLLTGTADEPLEPGAHTVSAAYAPADPTAYAASTQSAAQVVDPAATTTVLAVQPAGITARVTATTPGAGVPAGTVTFRVADAVVGTAPLVAGLATLVYTVPAGAARNVAAAYSGSTRHTASSDSTVRRDPTITAAVTSSRPASAFGWYSAPVDVTFTCSPGSAALSGPCPAPQRITQDQAGTTVTRTIAAVDGGVATVVVNDLKLDTTAPTARIKGVTDRAVYGEKRTGIRCVATDALSGVASCAVTARRRAAQVFYTATAVDKAGNTTEVRGRYVVRAVSIDGAPIRSSVATVRAGRSYTLVVHAKQRPTFYAATRLPVRPTDRVGLMQPAGRNRWTLGIRIRPDMHGDYAVAVRYSGRIHVVRLRAVRP